MKPIVTLIQQHLIKSLHEELKKDLPKHFSKGDSVCVKCHMGEYGNLNYIRPPLVGAVVEELKVIGCKPFLFDSPVAYFGSRDTEEKYLDAARKNGFTEETIGCPIVISNAGKKVKSKYLPTLEVCKKLVEADGLVVVSHFKGHDLASWGGAIKNLGMGAVTKASKGAIHSAFCPAVDLQKCTGCGTCVKTCPEQQIVLEKNKAKFLGCFGCGACELACPRKAIKGKGLTLSAGLAEATHHVLAEFDKKKLFFVSAVLDITNNCDCLPIGTCDVLLERVAPNIGLVISEDPVAVDKASFDLLNGATQGSFGKLWPADPTLQIEYGVKFGLGSKEYILKKL